MAVCTFCRGDPESVKDEHWTAQLVSLWIDNNAWVCRGAVPNDMFHGLCANCFVAYITLSGTRTASCRDALIVSEEQRCLREMDRLAR